MVCAYMTYSDVTRLRQISVFARDFTHKLSWRNTADRLSVDKLPIEYDSDDDSTHEYPAINSKTVTSTVRALNANPHAFDICGRMELFFEAKLPYAWPTLATQLLDPTMTLAANVLSVYFHIWEWTDTGLECYNDMYIDWLNTDTTSSIKLGQLFCNVTTLHLIGIHYVELFGAVIKGMPFIVDLHAAMSGGERS